MNFHWSEIVSRIASGAMFTLLIGCSTVPLVPRTASAQPAFSSDDSQLMYELLVSELAIRRGELDIAAEGYLSATKRTDDPRVAERATQLALYYQDWARAETAAQRWLTLDSGAVAAFETLAQIQLRQMDKAGAIEAFTQWLDASEDKSAAFETINTLLLRDPQQSFSYDLSTELTQLYPKQAQAHIGRAGLALAAGDQTVALEAADTALTLDSKSVEASLLKAQVLIDQGQSPDALDTLQTAVSEQPDSLPLHLGFAQLLVDSSLYDRAGPVLDRAGELSEGEPDTWLRLGLLSLQAVRYDQAQLFLEGVLIDDPLNERANFYLGRIFDTRHDNETAIRYFDAVPQGEFYITARIRAAELTAESGNLNDGLERIRELGPLALEPSRKIQLLSAESRLLQEADRGDEALAILNEGLKTYPGNTALLYSRALAGERNGNNQIMEDDLATIIEMEPNNAQALNALGYHLAVNNKRLDDAQIYLELATKLEPDDAAIMDSLGWLRFRQGRLEEAKELLTDAYAIFPDAEIAAHLGEVLWMQGDETAARRVWSKALEDEPNHKVLNAVLNRFGEK